MAAAHMLLVLIAGAHMLLVLMAGVPRDLCRARSLVLLLRLAPDLALVLAPALKFAAAAAALALGCGLSPTCLASSGQGVLALGLLAR